MAHSAPIRGVIFDLDGTLVDSGLDFDLMRREMELEPGRPVLEALAALSGSRAQQCRAILARHEKAGAERAQLMPGVFEMLVRLHELGNLRAVFTRNARQVTLATLERLNLHFETIVAREDAPPKPDPAGIWRICEAWGLSRRQVAMVGDFDFDIEAGRRAGVWTVLVHPHLHRRAEIGRPAADLTLPGFEDLEPWLRWLSEPS